MNEQPLGRSTNSLIGVTALVLALGVAAFSLARIMLPKGLDQGEPNAADESCARLDDGEVRIQGGLLYKGSGAKYREELPETTVQVREFWIDEHEVTNRQFARFVSETGYVTDAERAPEPSEYPEVPRVQLLAGGAVFVARPTADPHPNRWRYVAGASWRHPLGPESNAHGREQFPVVQISFNDALAYAHWLGRDLPTEDEFEYAARGGLEKTPYAWGNELAPGDRQMANTWQGEFPDQNRALDGYAGAAPVGCFPPNGYGLYDMIGNVWEWTRTPYSAVVSGTPAARTPFTIKGGSFLCAPNYCQRYRPAARQPEEAASSTMHLGFRTVRRPPVPEPSANDPAPTGT